MVGGVRSSKASAGMARSVLPLLVAFVADVAAARQRDQLHAREEPLAVFALVTAALPAGQRPRFSKGVVGQDSFLVSGR